MDEEQLQRLISKEEHQNLIPDQDLLSQVKSLIKAFGCPILMAPYEAEAHCASLMNEGIVDGIITEDSDVFLYSRDGDELKELKDFVVFEEFFKKSKNSRIYTACNIYKDLKIDKASLVMMALLLGCDFNLPLLKGLGPKLALNLCLYLQTHSKMTDTIRDVIIFRLDQLKDILSAETCDIKDASIMKVYKLFHKNPVDLSQFPSVQVIEAFLCPDVLHLTNPQFFQWKVPNTKEIVSILPPFQKESVTQKMILLLNRLNCLVQSGTWKASIS